MKKLSSMVLACSLLLSAAAYAQDDKVEPAKQAATAWLALTDSNDYGQSWDQASEMFKQSIEKTKWQETIQNIRSSLGTVKQRTLKSAAYSTTLPNAPTGEYVVIQYDTDFSNRGHAVETVVPARDKDGSWRVIGYFIR